MLKRWVRHWLESRGYAVFNTRSGVGYARDGLFTFNNDHFRHDAPFRAAYERGVRANGGVDPGTEWRVHVALWAAGVALRVEGDFVECGVNGGLTSTAIMERWQWSGAGRRYWLVDTFGGPVMQQYTQAEASTGRVAAARDALERGAYVTDVEQVRANFAEWAGVEIVQGAVPEALKEVKAERVAFLHLDMNCAFPERAALEHFWPKMSAGGVVLFDDYAYFGNEELARTIDEAARGLGAEVLSLPTGQGLMLR